MAVTPPVATTNLPQPTAFDEVLGNQTADGILRTGRLPLSRFATQMAAQAPFSQLVGATAGGMKGYPTEELLAAETAPEADTLARVYADPDPQQNGTWRKTGAAGQAGWEILPVLAERFIALDNAGAGTGDAIQLTSGFALPDDAYGATFQTRVRAANTGPVTIAVNGAAPRPLLTAAGNPLEANYLKLDMPLQFVDGGADYRMTSTASNAAIQASVEGLRNETESFRNETETLKDLSAGYVDDAASFAGYRNFQTIDLFEADAALSYSGGNPVSAGDVVRIRDKGFPLRVLASGATPFDNENANATPVRVEVIQDRHGWKHLEAYGVNAGNNAAQNDAALARALVTLDEGDTLVLACGGVVDFSDATLTQNKVGLHIEANTTLRQFDITGRGFKWQGNEGRLTGKGAIQARVLTNADYKATNDGDGIDRAIFHVTGDDLRVEDIEILTPSRCGIYFDECTGQELIGVRGDGGYDIADDSTGYNDLPASPFVNLWAVYYNTPTDGWWKLDDVKFRQFATPIGAANFGVGGNCRTILINSYGERCSDHFCYLIAQREPHIVGNYCQDVKQAIVTDGARGLIADNTLMATGTDSLYHEQGMSLRSCTDTEVVNNTIYGIGAYIDAAGQGTNPVTGNRIVDNRLRASLASIYGIAGNIRVSSGGLLDDNKIKGNKIVNRSSTFGQGVIQATGTVGQEGSIEISGNRMKLEGGIYPVLVTNQIEHVEDDNRVDWSGYSAPSPQSLDWGRYVAISRLRLKENKYRYLTGGANVTARTVSCQDVVNARAEGCEFVRTATGLVAVSNNLFAGGVTGTAERIENYYSTSARTGTLTFPAGTTTAQIVNPNITANSRVRLDPIDQNGANIERTHGLFRSIPGDGICNVITANGANTAVAGTFHYEITG